MRQTLHADLLDTSLMDFREHYERGLHEGAAELLGDVGGLWRVWDDEPLPANPGFKGWDLIAPAGHIRITRHAVGNTGITYLFRYSDTSEPGPLRFLLHAVRFQQSRVKVLIHEEGEEYASLFRAWLGLRWGEDGYIDREGKPGPAMVEDPYEWAAAQARRGLTYDAIYPGWEARYIIKYGPDKLWAMKDPRENMERTTRRRVTGR